MTDASDLPVLDEVGALRRCSGDAAFLRELLDDFLALYGDTAEVVRGHLQRGEVVQARARLHAIKGGGGNLGLLQLAAVASTLEKRLKEDPEADCVAEVATLAGAVRSLEELLRGGR